MARMGALCRYAAGGHVRGYAQGGQADIEDDDEDYGTSDRDEEPVEAGRYIEGLDDPGVAQGALSMAGQPAEKSQAITQLEESGAAFPHGAEIQGGLNKNRDAVNRAYDEQRNAILTGMRNIAGAGQGPTNMPLYMAAAGMLRPTRTGSFGESIGNAADAAAPEILRERELERQNAIASGELGIRAADVGVQQASGNLSDFYRQIGLGEKFDTAAATRQYYQDTLTARAAAAAEATRRAQIAAAAGTDRARIAAAARIETADAYRSGRVDAATIAASKGQYIGPSTQDPNDGLYLNPFTNQVAHGPASVGRGAGTANSKMVSDLEYMVAHGIAPDLSTAYAMRRSGVNDGTTFQRLIQNEKNILLKTPAGASMTPIELENQARETVVGRHPPTAAPVAAPGAPAPVPAPVTATPRVVTPQRPQNLPLGSMYNPARKQWKDPKGLIYDEGGKPVAQPHAQSGATGTWG